MSDFRELRWGSPGIVIHTITLFPSSEATCDGLPNLPWQWFCPDAVETEAEHID